MNTKSRFNLGKRKNLEVKIAIIALVISMGGLVINLYQIQISQSQFEQAQIQNGYGQIDRRIELARKQIATALTVINQCKKTGVTDSEITRAKQLVNEAKQQLDEAERMYIQGNDEQAETILRNFKMQSVEECPYGSMVVLEEINYLYVAIATAVTILTVIVILKLKKQSSNS